MEKIISFETKYRARISFDDHSSVNDILVSFYLPLIRSDALALYNILMADSRNTMINSIYINIDRLISMINLSIESLYEAITKLELVNLIEVFKDGDNQLLFILKKPLSPNEFNHSFQLSELFKSKSGSENLEISNKLFNSMKGNNSDELELLTKEINLNITSDGLNKGKLNVEFDFSSIKSILHSRKINYNKFWNRTIEKKLIDLIVVYRISSLDIGIELVNQIETEGFDLDKLIIKIKDNFSKKEAIESLVEKSDMNIKSKLDYITQMSVIDYFVSRLNRKPSMTESEMIKTLKLEYNFKDEIINILVDFSIIINNGAVNKNYILKISDTLLKEGYSTIEEVTKHLKVAYNLRKEEKTDTPLESEEIMEEIPEF